MDTEWVRYDDTARIIKYMREARGLNQKQVSLGSGVGQSLISDYEAGKTIPSLKSFCMLMKFFGYRIVIEKVHSHESEVEA